MDAKCSPIVPWKKPELGHHPSGYEYVTIAAAEVIADMMKLFRLNLSQGSLEMVCGKVGGALEQHLPLSSDGEI